MDLKDKTQEAPALKDPKAAPSTLHLVTAHVLGQLISECIINPLEISMDIPSLWEVIQKAVDRAIDGLDMVELTTAVDARNKARLERLR